MITNKLGLPESYEKAIRTNLYDKPLDKTTLTASMFSKSATEIILSHRHNHEIEEDVADLFWVLLGSSIHSVMDRITGKIAGKPTIKEKRMEEKLDGFTISGKPDLVYGDTIEDYKITSVYTYVFNPLGKMEWETQLNIYAWLYAKKGIKINHLNIIAMFRDWKQRNSQEVDYPSAPVVSIPLSCWDTRETEKIIKAKIFTLKAMEKMKDEDLPPCSKENRWRTTDTFAVRKKNRKTAVKVFMDKEEAEQFIRYQNSIPTKEDKGWYIEERKGEDRKCLQYCRVARFCPYYQKIATIAGIAGIERV